MNDFELSGGKYFFCSFLSMECVGRSRRQKSFFFRLLGVKSGISLQYCNFFICKVYIYMCFDFDIKIGKLQRLTSKVLLFTSMIYLLNLNFFILWNDIGK